MSHGGVVSEQSYDGQTAIDAENQIIEAAELRQNAAVSAELLDAMNSNLQGLQKIA